MEPLKVELVNFYPRKNGQTHNTIKFEVVNDDTPTTVIVRRGQPFNGLIRFDRPIDENKDTMQLVFTLGDKPMHDIQGSVLLCRDVVSDKFFWSAKIVSVDGIYVKFKVLTPVTLPVGNWALRVVTRIKGSPARVIYDYTNDLYILFNPWNPNDQTYMEDCPMLQEYVMNDVGKVWVGPIKSTRGRPWFYGQFDATVLPAVMFMLDRARMPYHNRGNPVEMSRVISRIVNSNDDDGVLAGRWDGKYEDGTSPDAWTGSADILAQYFETEQVVRYGQCWVFAGIVTTVCRALGLPSRVVSNIVSAHDANSSLTLDTYYTENMEEIHFHGADSVWNYHVWNDVWTARPDLPAGYGGWQAIDATPQETSAGMYQCGPAPLKAIKEGVVGLSYGVGFLLACVNADFMRWRYDPESETGYSMVDTNKYHIGRMVLTKKPFVFDPLGDADREDVTEQYKHREGTVCERLALMKGVLYSERAKRYFPAASSLSGEVSFKLRDIGTVLIGEEFRVIVDIYNNTGKGRNVKAALTATSVFYNGVRAEIVKKSGAKMFVGPGMHQEISLLVQPEDYLPKLVEYCNMKICAMAIVDETKKSWADDDDLQIIKPNINFKLNEDLVLGEPASVWLSFVNPLLVPLSEGEFRVTSSGIAGRTLRLAAPPTDKRTLLALELTVLPNKLGKIHLVATYKSNELKDINGAATVEVFEG